MFKSVFRLAVVLGVLVFVIVPGALVVKHNTDSSGPSTDRQGRASVEYQRDPLMRIRSVVLHRPDGSERYVVPVSQGGILFLEETTQRDAG